MDAEAGVSAEGDVGLGASTRQVVDPDGARALPERRHASRYRQRAATTVRATGVRRRKRIVMMVVMVLTICRRR